MSKILSTAVETLIESGDIATCMLARLHFSNSTYPSRYANAGQDIYWDEAGAGEEVYQAVGNLGSIEALAETDELQLQTIQLTLTGIKPETINHAMFANHAGNPAFIWRAILDKDTFAVIGDPVLMFAGRMDFLTISLGETAAVSIQVISRLSDWEKTKGGRFNTAYQITYVDPTDQGFQYLPSLVNKNLTWGDAPKWTGGSGGGGGTFGNERNPRVLY